MSIDYVPPGATTTVIGIERPEQWDDLALPDLDRPLPGEPVSGPLLLVCTHEQRDPCCGLEGQALVDAIGGPDVFACSHLGGHRFAPTAMVLPTGYVYGHLDVGSAAAIRARAAASEVETDGCRGRCTWSPAGQVAELALRAATGLRSPDALIMINEIGGTVHLNSTSGGRWAGGRPGMGRPRRHAPRLVRGPGHAGHSVASRGGAHLAGKQACRRAVRPGAAGVSRRC
jgi:hypothetical protein